MTLAATLLSNSRTNLPRRLQNHGLFSKCLAAKRDETNSIQNDIGRQNPQVVRCLFSNVDLFHQEFVRVGVLFATGAGIALWVASGRLVCIFHSCPSFTRRSKKYFSRQVSRLQKSTVHNLSFSLARETPKNILKNPCLPVFLASNKRPTRHQNHIPTANRLLISPTRKSICEMSLCPGSYVHDREGVMILSFRWIDLKHWWETGAMDPKTNHISKISQEKLLPRRAFPSHREATTSEHPAELLLEEKMLKARKLDEP